MRLIDADALIACLLTADNRRETDWTTHVVYAQPTIEPKRAEWRITSAYPHNVYCSACYKIFAQAHWSVWEDGSLPRDYCPNCGAKMEDKTRNNKRGTN